MGCVGIYLGKIQKQNINRRWWELFQCWIQGCGYFLVPVWTIPGLVHAKFIHVVWFLLSLCRRFRMQQELNRWFSCFEKISSFLILFPFWLVTGVSRLDDQIFINRNPGVPSVVKFHPFNTCIAVADKDSIWSETQHAEWKTKSALRPLFTWVSHLMIFKCKADQVTNHVCVSCSFWDWEKGERLDYFYNGNPRYTRITSMEYLNGHDCSLLLTATGLKHMNMRTL